MYLNTMSWLVPFFFNASSIYFTLKIFNFLGLFWLCRMACRILFPWPETESMPPAVGVQSLDHCIARDISLVFFLSPLSMSYLDSPSRMLKRSLLLNALLKLEELLYPMLIPWPPVKVDLNLLYASSNWYFDVQKLLWFTLLLQSECTFKTQEFRLIPVKLGDENIQRLLR